MRNLQKIAWVIKDGKVVDRTYHPWFRNPLPNSAVQALAWVAALKQQSMQTTAFGQPSPGIESISPGLVTEGDGTLNLTVKGVGFTSRSLIYFDDEPLPTRFVGETELSATVDGALIAKAGTFAVTVRNPEPWQRPEWGGTSNRAHLLVNFKY